MKNSNIFKGFCPWGLLFLLVFIMHYVTVNLKQIVTYILNSQLALTFTQINE